MGTETKHTPGPWTWRDSAGAGIQIGGTLPAGFKFDATDHGVDGKTSFMLFTLRDPQGIWFGDARWVQFQTAPWKEMQEANARLIAAAPDLLAACEAVIEEAKRVVESCLRGHSQHAEEAAYSLSEGGCGLKAAIAKATGATP